jgi:hypothetical protein
MKKILVLIFTSIGFFCGLAKAQKYLPETPTFYGEKVNRLKAVFVQHIPQKDSTLLNTNDSTAQMFINKKDSSLWVYYKPTGFFKAGGHNAFLDTSHLSTRIDNSYDSAKAINDSIFVLYRPNLRNDTVKIKGIGGSGGSTDTTHLSDRINLKADKVTTITINSVTYDLSTNRVFNVGTLVTADLHYDTLQKAGVTQPQRKKINFGSEFNADDNTGNNSTDISVFAIGQSKITDLQDSLNTKLSKRDSSKYTTPYHINDTLKRYTKGFIGIDYTNYTNLISGPLTFQDSTLVPVFPSGSAYWNNGLIINTSYSGGIENSYFKAFDYGNVFNENFSIRLIFQVLDSSSSLRIGTGIKANAYNSTLSANLNAVNWINIPILGDTTGSTMNNKCSNMTKTSSGLLVNKWDYVQVTMDRELDSVALHYKNLTSGESKDLGRRSYFTVGPGEYTSITGWPAIFSDKGNTRIIDFSISKPKEFKIAVLGNSIPAAFLTTKRDSSMFKQAQLHTALPINIMASAGLASPEYLYRSKELDALKNKIIILFGVDGNNPVWGISNAQSRIYQDSIIKRFRSQGNRIVFVDNTKRYSTLGAGGWLQLDSLNLRLDTIRLPQDSVVHVNNLMVYPDDYLGGVHLNDGGNTRIANYLISKLPEIFNLRKDSVNVGTDSTLFATRRYADSVSEIVPTLNQVTTAGNTTTNNIIINDGTDPLAQMINDGGEGRVSVFDASHNEVAALLASGDVQLASGVSWPKPLGDAILLQDNITGSHTIRWHLRDIVTGDYNIATQARDSTGSPINMIYEGTDGYFHKAAVPSFSGGLTSLNGLTGSTQTFATGTSGTNFNISSTGTAHTFNIPTASASNRGLLSTTDWTTFNNKQPAGNYLGIADTSAMLSSYFRSNISADTYATISNLGLKVNISDTANMLLKYLRKQDTAAMLSPYLKFNIFNSNGSLTSPRNINGLTNSFTIDNTGTAGVSFWGGNSSSTPAGYMSVTGNSTGFLGGINTSSSAGAYFSATNAGQGGISTKSLGAGTVVYSTSGAVIFYNYMDSNINIIKADKIKVPVIPSSNNVDDSLLVWNPTTGFFGKRPVPSAGTGITSIGLTVPSWLSVSGSPLTSNGTLAVTEATGQAANLFLATPNGSTGAVGLRVIASADLPVLPIANGGTNNGSLSVTHGNIYYGDGTKIVSLAPGTSGQLLKTNGAAANPSWATVSGTGDAIVDNPLSQFASTTSNQLSGVISDETGAGPLVFANAPALTNIQINNIVGNNFQSVVTAAGTTTLTVNSPNETDFTGTSTQTAVLPDATTLRKGTSYLLKDLSTGNITVNKNGGTLLATMIGSTSAMATVTDTTTAAGGWVFEYSTDLPIGNATGKTITLAGASPGTITTGKIESDASNVLHMGQTSTERGVIGATQYSVVATDFTLSAALGVQPAFPTTGDVWTLAGSTLYQVEGSYTLTTGTTTTKTTALAFALAGGASINFINLQVIGYNSVPNTVTTAQGTTAMTQVASTVITATSTTAGVQFFFKGVISMNAGGTVTPQINFSANPGGTNLMKAGSYIKFTKLGVNTFSTEGSVN